MAKLRIISEARGTKWQEESARQVKVVEDELEGSPEDKSRPTTESSLQNQGQGTHAGYSMLHTAASRGDKAAGPRR